MQRFEKQLSVYGKRAESTAVPSDEDWMALEAYFGFRLPQDFKVFVAEAADYYFEGEVPSRRVDDSSGCLPWLGIVRREREESGNPIPSHLVPFCGVGNGDYHCFRILDRETGSYDVVYWDHEIPAAEQSHCPQVLAKDFGEWIDGYTKDKF